MQIAPQADAAQGEAAELVGQHRLELDQVDHVDQPQADQKVLAGRQDQVQQRRVVDQRGIHLGADVDATRRRRPHVLVDAVNEGEEQGVVLLAQGDVGRDRPSCS